MSKAAAIIGLLVYVLIFSIISTKLSSASSTSLQGTTFVDFEAFPLQIIRSIPGILQVTAHLNNNEVTANFTISGSSKQWQTPASVPLANGTYTVICIYNGQQKVATVSVIEGQTTSVDFDFSRLYINNPIQIPQPDQVQPMQNVTILVNVTSSSPIKNVILFYTLNDSTLWTNLTMNYNVTSTLYQTVIPGQPEDTLVKYGVTAYDNQGNQVINDNDGHYFKYRVLSKIKGKPIVPKVSIFGAIVVVATLAFIIILFTTKKRRRKFQK
jgi:hypothetical protein